MMRMLPTLTLTLPLTVAACSPTIATEEPVREVERGQDLATGGEGICRAEGTGSFIGRPATQELGAQVLRATGARTFQWVGPDTLVTMDFRSDRVRVSYDERSMVTEIRCG